MKPWTRKDRRGLSKSLWPITGDPDKRGPSVKRARLVSGNEISDLEAIPGCEFQVCKLPPGSTPELSASAYVVGRMGRGGRRLVPSLHPSWAPHPPALIPSYCPHPHTPPQGEHQPLLFLKAAGKKKKKKVGLRSESLGSESSLTGCAILRSFSNVSVSHL